MKVCLHNISQRWLATLAKVRLSPLFGMSTTCSVACGVEVNRTHLLTIFSYVTQHHLILIRVHLILRSADPTPLGNLESTFYRSTVGQIQYFAHIVRHDVAHAISRLGQYSQHPTEGAYKALTRGAREGQYGAVRLD